MKPMLTRNDAQLQSTQESVGQFPTQFLKVYASDDACFYHSKWTMRSPSFKETRDIRA